MLSLFPGHARLVIPKDEEFSQVSESLRALLHVSRLNGLRGGLVVSEQDPFDWRSSLRIALRFAAERGPLQDLRLALVASHFNDGARDDVLAVARESGLECRVFRDEAQALAWLTDAAPGREEPRR